MRPIGGRTRAWCLHEIAAHRELAWLLATAALFGCVLSGVRMHDPVAASAGSVAVAAVVYAAAAAVLIMRWPAWLVPALAAVGAVLAMGIGAQQELLGPVLVLGLLIFSLGSERGPVIRWTLIVLCIVLAGDLLFELHRKNGLSAFGVLPWAAFAAAIGQAVRAKRQQQAMLEERARRAEEGREAEARRRVQDERLRIARDLHDAVGHHVALISVQAGAMGYLLHTDLDKARDSLTNIQQASKAALEELRLTVGLLRQPGEAEPVEPLGGLSRLDELIGSFAATGLRVRREITGQVRPLPEAVDLTAYRVIQESLTNAAKHAPGAAASVRLGYGPAALLLAIADDGPALASAPGEEGHGIVGMRERATAVGGWLSAGPRKDGPGFLVLAELPIPCGGDRTRPEAGQ